MKEPLVYYRDHAGRMAIRRHILGCTALPLQHLLQDQKELNILLFLPGNCSPNITYPVVHRVAPNLQGKRTKGPDLQSLKHKHHSPDGKAIAQCSSAKGDKWHR